MNNLNTNEKITNNEMLGRISEVQKNSFRIKFQGQDIPAKLKGFFYEESADKLPVVGDYVNFIYNPSGDSMIQSVQERKSFLQRPDQAKTGVMQYMVANVDYVFIVTSLNEDYSYNRIARYVSMVLQGGATPIVILTKSDLCNNVGRYIREVETIAEDVRVHAISAIYDIGMDELEEYLQPGKTICLMGSSGAGKSTLLNAITGEEKPEDYYNTELMAMRSFWNKYYPGASEHYLIRIVRESEDYIPEISRVAELDGKIVGAVFYTRAWIVDGDTRHEVVTFGPLAVEPTLEGRLTNMTMELTEMISL